MYYFISIDDESSPCVWSEKEVDEFMQVKVKIQIKQLTMFNIM